MRAGYSRSDPISVTRADFDAAYDTFVTNGIKVKPDRDQAWRDFAGWRVNYDTVLIALVGLAMAPEAPWCLHSRQTASQMLTAKPIEHSEKVDAVS